MATGHVVCPVDLRVLGRGKIAKPKWPVELRHPEMRGLYVGGCVVRGIGSRFRAKAHAHTEEPWRGWICMMSGKWAGCSLLLKHELAHIVTREGHTNRWRDYLLQIGGTIDPVPGISRSYHAQPRKLVTIASHE
jgi:hypothetical protein